MLEAHDVSYFVNINQLKTGDLIRYSTPCFTYVFSVQNHQVVQQGSPVYNTPTPSITLVTCWPTNALLFTPQRYLVTATHLLTVARTGPGGIGAGAGATNIVVPPRPCRRRCPHPPRWRPGPHPGHQLDPHGTAHHRRATRTQSWVQGPGPLAVEGSAVEGFIAGVRSLTQNRDRLVERHRARGALARGHGGRHR